MSDPDRIKQAWRASVADPVLPDLAMVRAGADRFYRKVRRRNAIEYAACVFVIACFATYGVVLPSPAVRIGAAMIVAGTLVVGWQLRRLASAVPPPERAAMQPILFHQRAQLVRQRDALAGIFTWYLLPLIPGLLVITFARVLDRGVAGLLHVRWQSWMVLLMAVATFGGVWLLNQRAARRLQKQIDDIDTLTGRIE